MDENQRNIDESWKEAVEKEKQAAKESGKITPPDADFNFFVTTLALQASISLGQIPNPATNKVEEDLVQSRFLIDTLSMLKDKTKGNLTEEEAGLLDNLLYELRLVYVAKTKGEAK